MPRSICAWLAWQEWRSRGDAGIPTWSSESIFLATRWWCYPQRAGNLVRYLPLHPGWWSEQSTSGDCCITEQSKNLVAWNKKGSFAHVSVSWQLQQTQPGSRPPLIVGPAGASDYAVCWQKTGGCWMSARLPQFSSTWLLRCQYVRLSFFMWLWKHHSRRGAE